MGGQACVLYGAAEFSRDTDIAILASDENLELLRNALRALKAQRIALPPFEKHYLEAGHAIHFRANHPDSHNIRIDIMSVMRGLEDFEQLWQRKEMVVTPSGERFELLSLRDLVRSKKTQRDKDWPMIRRLVEADFVKTTTPSRDQVKFWLEESRTPEMLVWLTRNFPVETEMVRSSRPLLGHAQVPTGQAGDLVALDRGLDEEQRKEREKDRQYWEPLRKQLEQMRHQGYSTEDEV